MQDLTRAVTGFAGMLRFMKEDFLCDKCGDTPAYIVCDGKSIGPAKRKVNHLSELDRAEETYHKYFLAIYPAFTR